MKELILNLALFAVFCIAISGMTACSGTSTTTNGVNPVNSATQAPVTNVSTPDSKTSIYPQLSPAIADADLEMLDGTNSKISDRKGKVVLLNMWGIWCGPCRAEMPELVALQQTYGDQGFEVIGLNIGDGNGRPEGLEAIKAFGEKMQLNYTLVRIPNSMTSQFYLITRQDVVPQSFLVNREGQLRAVFTGGGPRITNLMKETVAKAMTE